MRSLRHDPLAALHAAKQLDDAQYMAGRHWQRNRELAEIGGVRAVDPTKEAVDGGRLPEARISDAQIKAFKEMAGAMKALGMEGGALVQAFLDQGLTLKDIADKWARKPRGSAAISATGCGNVWILWRWFSAMPAAPVTSSRKMRWWWSEG